MPTATPFRPSRDGFPFPNWFPPGTPVLELPTPLGRVPIGNAGGGVCGGMVFAARDLFDAGRPVPPEPGPPVFRYLCRRLIDSFDLPFGVLKYYDWQRRPDDTTRWARGVSYLTIAREWPRVRAALDAGRPAPLGLVKARSFDPRRLGENHQVLAYAYDLDPAAGELVLQVYDPNFPKDDDAALQVNLHDPHRGRPVYHTREGPSVRGFFLTRYRAPQAVPEFPR